MNPSLSSLYIPSIIFICITALPFYVALILAWLICNDISNDKSFTCKNAARLKKISMLAVSESVLYILACIIMVVLNLYHINILLVAMLIILAGIVIAVVSAALSHLVENASELKENNDLTI